MPEFYEKYKALTPSRRILLGPGPSLVHPRVLRAMSTPLIGHLDPEFLTIMNETQELLRWLFQTNNQFTIAVSGTGSAAMETAIANLIESGDRVIVGINGVFGNRIAQMVTRCGGTVIEITAPWGKPIPFDQIAHLLQTAGPIKAVALVHAETSTGVWQPLEGVGALCHQHDALLIVDAVTSLGGIPVEVFAGADQGFRVTVEQLEASRNERTKVLVFVSPSNPTGAVYRKEEIEAIGRWAVENDIWVITDEIYEHLVYGDAVHHSMPVLVPEILD